MPSPKTKFIIAMNLVFRYRQGHLWKCYATNSRRNFQITSSTKTSITTLQCICANGNIIPPCVLFPGVKFNLEYSIGFPKNFYLGFTKNGWMDMKQFYGWIMNHFVKKIPLLRPVVLLVDGHGSHIDYYVSKFCLVNTMLFRLPPHTSHVIQPTDRGFFGAFKHNFSKETAKFTVEHPGVSITKRQFPYVFTKAYESSCKMETVKSSFWATGIWPTDRLQVDHDLFNPSKAYRDSNLSNISQNLPINFEIESTSTVKMQNPDQGDNPDSVPENLASSCPSFSAAESHLSPGRRQFFNKWNIWKSIVSSMWSFSSNICCARVYCHRKWINTKRHFSILTKFYSKDPAK